MRCVLPKQDSLALMFLYETGSKTRDRKPGYYLPSDERVGDRTEAVAAPP